MRHFIICVLLAFTGFATIAQPNTNKPTRLPAAGDWLSYTDTASGLSVKYPAGWRLKTTNPRAPIVLHAPTEGDNDTFSENLNYMINPISSSQQINVQAISGSLKSDLSNQIHNFALLEEKKLTWLGYPAIELSYTGASDATSTATKVKILQRVVATKTRLIIATYTAEGGKTDVSFDDAVKIINQTTFKQ